MNSYLVALEAFHFLRPLWLLAILPVALIWLIARRSNNRRRTPTDVIAAHLRIALTKQPGRRHRILPVDGVAIALLCLIIGTSGPTWSRQPDPFIAQSAPLVVVLKVTDSMLNTDIAPSRLERAKQKIRDLLDLRGGVSTGLVAYAGTAHATVPLTEDPSVALPYLTGLSPDVMPEAGNRASDAVALARDLLARETMPGNILIVADALDPGDVMAIDDPRVIVLAMLPDKETDRGFVSLSSSEVITVTPNGEDVTRIDQLLDAAYAQTLLENDRQPWLDRAFWFAWPGAFLVLLWFRQGWTMRWGAVIAYVLFSLSAPQAHSDGIADWFLTPDQQGQLAFNKRHYKRAAELFVDPLHRGYALYRDGQYEESAKILTRVETAQAAFVQGMAYIKSRSYRDGVSAFETALKRDPAYPGAAENLKTAQEILEYIERAREQSDTGEEGGIGADEIVYDNKAKKGTDTKIKKPDKDTGPKILTETEWLNTVDTRTSGFLKTRFALEAAHKSTLAEAEEGKE